MNNNYDIELLGMRTLNKGGLLATADIKYNGITINQMRLMQNAKGEKWVDVPLLHWLDRGQHYYQKAIELDDDLLNKIEERIINEYRDRTKHS